MHFAPTRASFLCCLAGGLLVLVSCTRPRDPCKDLHCRHNAPCVEGACQCSLPYTGHECQIDEREGYLGTWSGSANCILWDRVHPVPSFAMHDSLPILLKVQGLYQKGSEPADNLQGEAELKGFGEQLEIRFSSGESWQAERRSVGLLGGGGTALDVSARGCTIRLFRQ